MRGVYIGNIKIVEHKSWSYFSRGPGFDSHFAHISKQPSVTLVPEGMTVTSGQQSTKHILSTLT